MSTFLPAVILGGGVSGLAAGIASCAPVFERERFPGGICSSYYVRPGMAGRESAAQADGRGYRFEHGGGHWIFGGHRDVLSMIERLAPCQRIARRSAVYFPDEQRYVGFPLQHHLHQLDAPLARAALAEMQDDGQASEARTMAEWLERAFGRTLYELFFAPFHDAYTAGLFRSIAPQDGYKTPLDRQAVLRGATSSTAAAGYNVTFAYPREGLDALMQRLAARVDWRPGHAVVAIDAAARTLRLADGANVRYGRLLSTLPLNRMLDLCGIAVASPPDPYTSVLVLNIGARRGPRYPAEHWLYVPRSRSGFHRVGFYDNVADHFVPATSRGRVGCLYVERSFANGERPADEAVAAYGRDVIAELRDWGFVDDVEALDPTWIDVAYTWTLPGSTWVREATEALALDGIELTGRYARWQFQGIADSLRDGLLAGQALRLSL